jgi:hypothetical protein
MIWLTVARIAIGRITSKLPWQIWASLAVALFLGVSAWYIDNRAFSRGFAKADAAWVAKVQAEVARQVTANDAAWAAAQERIARLTEAKEVRDATIARLNREAAEDPNADRESIGADGVRRLNHRD